MTGDWGKLRSEELHYLVDHLNNKIGGTCGSNGGAERCMKILVGKPKRKRPLSRSRRGWEDIKFDLKETEWDGVNRHVS